MISPQISLVAYESRDPKKVFVRVPNQRGRWMLVDRCVVEVPCPACNAAVGEPCRSKCSAGRKDYMVDTHYNRRQKWMFSRDRWEVIGVPPDQLEQKPRIRTQPAVAVAVES